MLEPLVVRVVEEDLDNDVIESTQLNERLSKK